MSVSEDVLNSARLRRQRFCDRVAAIDSFLQDFDVSRPVLHGDLAMASAMNGASTVVEGEWERQYREYVKIVGQLQLLRDSLMGVVMLERTSAGELIAKSTGVEPAVPVTDGVDPLSGWRPMIRPAVTGS